MLATDLPLSPRDRAALLLALGEPTATASRAVGVHPTTLRRWYRTPDFRANVDRLRQRLLDRAVDSLTAGVLR